MTDLEKELTEALRGLLANAPAPKRIRDDFSYTLYREAARKAIAKAEGHTPLSASEYVCRMAADSRKD